MIALWNWKADIVLKDLLFLRLLYILIIRRVWFYVWKIRALVFFVMNYIINKLAFLDIKVFLITEFLHSQFSKFLLNILYSFGNLNFLTIVRISLSGRACWHFLYVLFLVNFQKINIWTLAIFRGFWLISWITAVFSPL